MSRKSVGGAPETSRLVHDAPPELLRDFLFSGEFDTILPAGHDADASGLQSEALQERLRELLRSLSRDRVQQIESEARRITAIADDMPAALLMRMAGNASTDALARQRDALARSLWCRLYEGKLFGRVERALQVEHFRDRKKLFTAFDLMQPMGLPEGGIDAEQLASEISGRLRHDEGCDVDVVELPVVDESRRAIMLVITSAGDFSSQKTVEGRTLKKLYYRPPNEVILVYSPTEGRIEACAPDPEIRRLASNIFAEVILGVDVTGRPVTRKVYDLSRFRDSLDLPVPYEEREVVLQARLTEIKVTLGSWKKLLTLKVTPEDDIDSFAREAFGSLGKIRNAGYIAGLEFNIRYLSRASDRERRLSFRIIGRNSCSLQSETDPEKRELGFRLLQHWKILAPYRDLSSAEFQDALQLLLLLYDHPDDEVPGSFLADHGPGPEALERSGHVSRIGVSDVVLLDEEIFGEHIARPTRSQGGASVLEAAEDLGGREVPTEDLARFRIERALIREKLEEWLGNIPRRGKTRVLGAQLAHLGEMDLGGGWTPAFLARALEGENAFNRVERLIRQESPSTGGIVFVGMPSPFEFIGAHVVVPLKDAMGSDSRDRVNLDAVRVRHAAARAGAAAGAAVHFRKSGPHAAVLRVPRLPAWQIVGAARVTVIERLYGAYLDGSGPMHGRDLLTGFESEHPRSIFSREWKDVENVYIRSPARTLWELCT